MPKLIKDMQKKKKKFEKELRATRDEDRRLYIEGELHILNYYIEELESGTFDPTPPVQPDTGEVIKDE